MNERDDRTPWHARENWQRFFLLIGIALYGLIGISFIPITYTDLPTEWKQPAILCPLSLGLAIACHWLFRRDRLVFKVQGVILWLLFGAMFLSTAYELIKSYLFLHGYTDIGRL